MRPKQRNIAAPRILVWLLAITALCATGMIPHVAAQSKQQTAQVTQKAFDTPELAAQALVQAAETYDVPALMEILGPGSRDLVVSEDPVEDKNRAAALVRLAHQTHSVAADRKNPARAEISFGNDSWPFPIPLVNRNGKWFYDAKAGRDEILFRRIGENELDAIQICRGFVEAQQEYALEKHDGVNQFAQRIISTPGKRDGLAWQNPDGSWGGPVGEAVAKAVQQGYGANQPYHGYYFKVLKGQGPAVPLGELDFVVKGVMIGGFALAAAPAQYKATGVQTFIVSQDGVVYQKDLGLNTLTLFKNMERYNPDKTWRRTDDEP